MPVSPGKFIVLDGVEGCGKSTQSRLLADWLAAHGTPALLTHEPGATPVGAALRHLLLQGEAEMTPLTETFLFCADRAEHVSTVIVPALLAGSWVICDRFSAATFAYQVWAGLLPAETFYALDGAARSGLAQVPGREASTCQPDLPLILALDPAVGSARQAAAAAAAPDNFERRPAAYHQKVRAGFLKYAQHLGASAIVLDADQPAAELHQHLLLALGLSD